MPSPMNTFESLLEAVPDALVGVDSSGKIRFVNQQTESLFGYPRSDLIGATLETLVPESARQIHLRHQKMYHAAPVARPMGTDLELRGRRGDGTEFPVDISLSSSRIGNGLLTIAAVRDVTDRVRADREREEMIRRLAVIEYSADGIITATPDGTITGWNLAAEKIYGYSSQEMIGRSAATLSPDDRIGEMTDVLEKINAGEHLENHETIRVRKNGTAFPVAITFSPVLGPDGAVTGVSMFCRDITEQQKVFEVTQRMATIVQNSGDPIISTTLDGIVTSWNPAAERVYGYSGEEMVSTSIQPLLPPDRAGEIGAILTRVGAGQSVEHLETVGVRKDGTRLPISLTASPIRGADGSVTGVAVISRDVTEERKAAEAVRRMASIVENSQDAIIATSLDDTITSWNPAAERMFGWTGAEAIEHPGRLLVPQERMAETRRILTAIGAGQPVEPLETVRVRKDGTAFAVSMTVSPINDADGTVIGVSSIVRDLTRQREASELSRSMIEASVDSMVSISPEGRISDANEATVRLTGIPRNQLVGTSFSTYFTDPDRAEQIYQRVFEEESVSDYPLTLRHHGAHVTYTEVLYNASIYRDPSGRVLGVFAASRDVTRQVQAQREATRQQAMELERLAELERFQRLTVGRELKMIELKKQIEYLRKSDPDRKGQPDDQR